jgi:hypothetical protein
LFCKTTVAPLFNPLTVPPTVRPPPPPGGGGGGDVKPPSPPPPQALKPSAHTESQAVRVTAVRTSLYLPVTMVVLVSTLTGFVRNTSNEFAIPLR